MPSKGKGKKSKKGDEDEFWEKAVETTPSKQDASSTNLDEPLEIKKKSAFSGFTALSMTEDVAGEPLEEEEDFGGLMSALKATAANPKKDKKKKKGPVIFDDDIPRESKSEKDDESKKPVQITADDLADEEWGRVKEKGKKAKKGKGKKDEDEDGDLDGEVSIQVSAKEPAAEQGKAEIQEEDSEPKVLSKKEKEKLKKDRDKAKKKAQAVAKKSTAIDEPAEPEPTVTKSVDKQAEDEKEEEGEGEGVKADSKKKKKKKAKKDEETVPQPTTAASGKKKGGISALKALMDEKKRLEEEAKRLAEEERKRIEEEERRAEEEELLKEAEKQRKKEREKAKRELAKKEGRLLTKKQKEEKAAAERRREALIQSGVVIEGLQSTALGSAVAKRVVYGNRKKKASDARGSKVQEPTLDSEEAVPESRAKSEVAEKDLVTTESEAKDEWDASSGEENGVAKEVKDSWDASSGSETDVQDVPAPKENCNPKPSQTNVTTTANTPTRNQTVSAPVKTSKSEQVSEDASESEDGSDESSSESEGDSEEESSSDEELTSTQRMAAQRKAEAAARRAKAHEQALAAQSKDNLRSPICCILGHVDTGKTKILDKIRQTNVQEGEAGGITQQIGATYFPVDAIKQKTKVMNKDGKQEYKIPGLLIIDTPGHESFTNLRTRGSSLCNIAVLVVDIMHGLEPQTLESLRLLRDRKTPFIVALNKIDRMYGWDVTPDGSFRDSLAKQKKSVQREFEDRVEKTQLAFAEQGLNAVLYYENKNFARNVSLVPTSAVTGEGVPDMIMLLVNLTQQRLSESLMYLSELECTVLEVKVIEGLGTTIDVVLSNGILREGERIVVCGLNGPIVTNIRALLTPQPLRELRVKSAYVHNKEVRAALGVKITAPDLDKAIAGSRLLVVGPDDDEDELREEVMSDLTSLLNSIDKSGRGVCVQASTLGSLEALLDFLKVSKIPVSGINIGPVHKRDIMRAATMLEKAKELACILCFDVSVDKEAEKMAEEMGIRLFKADIIYHLFDSFTAYNAEITEAKRKDAAPQAVWPCRLKIIAVFCKRDPIILGVDILDGTLRVGTPLAVVRVDPTTQKKEIVELGRITSLEINHKTQDIVKKSQAGGGVAVKIEHAVYQSAKMFGRHFEEKDEILSHISRQSIDVLKASFKADVSNEEWLLIKALKPRFNIQ